MDKLVHQPRRTLLQWGSWQQISNWHHVLRLLPALALLMGEVETAFASFPQTTETTCTHAASRTARDCSLVRFFAAWLLLFLPPPSTSRSASYGQITERLEMARFHRV
jgi:hypothetical protein